MFPQQGIYAARPGLRGGRLRSPHSFRHLLVDCLTNRLFCGNINLVVLDGELAVPCTRNPP